MNKDLLDFAGVEALEMSGGDDIFLSASLLGYSASSRRFLKRMNGEAWPRQDVQMAIAKTLILSGECDWEAFGIAMNVAMSEFDRQERNRQGRRQARRRRS